MMISLYEKLYNAGCVKFGEFKLKSGILSPVYVDFRVLVSRPALLAEVGRVFGGVADFSKIQAGEGR